jgi:hypothetical protein
VVRAGDPLHTIPLVYYLETSVQLVGRNGSKQTPCGKPTRSGDLFLAYTSPIARDSDCQSAGNYHCPRQHVFIWYVFHTASHVAYQMSAGR